MSALTCDECGKPHPEFVEACDCALRARIVELETANKSYKQANLEAWADTQKLLESNDCLRARVAELERGWDTVLLALGTIRKNAKSQIDGMNSMGVPDDAPERKAAIWYYTEANDALR